MEGIVVKNPLYPWLDTAEYSEPPSCLYSRWIVTSRVQDSRLQHHSFPQKALERTGFLNPRYETGLLEKLRIFKDQLRQIFSELEWCTGYFSLISPMNLTSHFRFSTCFYTLLRPPGCHRTFGQPAAPAIVHVRPSTHHTTHPLNGHHSPQPANVLRSLTPCRHTASDSSHRLTTDYTCHSSEKPS